VNRPAAAAAAVTVVLAHQLGQAHHEGGQVDVVHAGALLQEQFLQLLPAGAAAQLGGEGLHKHHYSFLSQLFGVVLSLLLFSNVHNSALYYAVCYAPPFTPACRVNGGDAAASGLRLCGLAQQRGVTH